jgi:CHAT domain-containing protein
VSLNNLALLYSTQGRYAEAEPLYLRALAIDEKTLGPYHRATAANLNNLGALYYNQGRYAEAEPLYLRALAIREKTLGPEHPDTAASLHDLAFLYGTQGRYAEALTLVRRATNIHRDRWARSGRTRSTAAESERATVRPIFLNHVEYASLLIETAPDRALALTAEAFEVGQLARSTSTAAAVARMAARFAAGDDALAHLVRDRQDAVAAWQSLDRALVEAFARAPGERDADAEIRLRADLAALDDRLIALDAELTDTFPDYTELAAPRPVALANIQKLLRSDEALLTYLVLENVSFLWVVRADRASLYRLAIGEDELEDLVVVLRDGLDPTGILHASATPPYDGATAHALYTKVFAPAEPLLGGAKHLLVVTDSALQSLPLGVLLTEAPEGALDDFSGYRDLAWLARDYVINILPSVGSLRALRRFAQASQADLPFVGFGDPELGDDAGGGRGVDIATLFQGRAVADVNQVRQLARLPETAEELWAMASSLGAGLETVYLRDRATETQVRSMDLRGYRTLAFATHGLVAGPFAGMAEPALVLTPPEEGTVADDGLLTASEIATLKLDADWVILSACNTAAADGTPEAEGLSGLAKAFFYAGSRALPVSHWAVSSDAAVDLTTGTFEALATAPGIGRSEALRRSMLTMMADDRKPYFAHPMFWAPFVVVGEVGANVQQTQ